MSRRPKQLSMMVRLYRVTCDGFADLDVQAASAPGAKYQAFKKAREAGYFKDERIGFRTFLSRGFKAREICN